LSILRVLNKHDVQFIVVGGVAAVLQGVPVSTFDLDVVHSTETTNVKRAIAALAELDAFYRSSPERKLRCTPSHLSSPGHQLLLTRFAPLDMLDTIGRGRDYQTLLPETDEIEITNGWSVQVLSLPSLIAVKKETAGEKDKAMLALLHATLDEKRHQDHSRRR
jgi:hypothetical protein